MMRPFEFTVRLEVEQGEGAPVRRNEIIEQTISALNDADPGDFDREDDRDGSAFTVSWEVESLEER